MLCPPLSPDGGLLKKILADRESQGVTRTFPAAWGPLNAKERNGRERPFPDNILLTLITHKTGRFQIAR